MIIASASQFHIYLPWSVFNQDKALEGAFTVITNLRMDLRFKLRTWDLRAGLQQPLVPAIAAVGHNLNRFLNQNYERNYDELDSLMTNSFTYLLSPSLKYFHSIMLKRFSSTIKPPLIYYTGFWSTNLMFYWKCYSVPHVNAGNPRYAGHHQLHNLLAR